MSLLLKLNPGFKNKNMTINLNKLLLFLKIFGIKKKKKNKSFIEINKES
jgi:hypothetical protein